MKYKRALVTGGAGFIGSHICEELVKTGIDVISTDNYISGKEANHAHLDGLKNFEALHCDVLNYHEMDRIVQGVDVIFHQAASKKTVCLHNPHKDLDVNAHGTFYLLESAVRHDVKKFVHASTGSVYGEAQYRPQDEKHPLNPTSYYGCSKLAGERYVKAFEHLYGLDTTVLRYFHVYGSRQESSDVGGVVAIFAKKILSGEQITIYGDGTQQRSFTYVKDVVNANLKAMNYEGGLFNCASGICVTVGELAKLIGKILGKKVDIEYKDWQPGDIKEFKIDNRLIRGSLKMGFVNNLEEGLKETLK